MENQFFVFISQSYFLKIISENINTVNTFCRVYNRVHSSCSQSLRKRNCMSNIEDLAKNIRRLYRSNLLDLTLLILTTIYAAATRESSHHHHKHYASISDLPVAIASLIVGVVCCVSNTHDVAAYMSFIKIIILAAQSA